MSLAGTQPVGDETLSFPEETWAVSATAATGTIELRLWPRKASCTTRAAASANFTLNFRWSGAATLASILPVGTASFSVVFLNTDTGTAFYPTVFQIDSVAVTPKWAGGTAPSSGQRRRGRRLHVHDRRDCCHSDVRGPRWRNEVCVI